MAERHLANPFRPCLRGRLGARKYNLELHVISAAFLKAAVHGHIVSGVGSGL